MAASIYELYGRQAEQLAQVGEYFQKTQELLTKLRSGEVLPSQLVLSQAGWELRDEPAGTQESNGDSEEPRFRVIPNSPGGLPKAEEPSRGTSKSSETVDA